MNQEALVVNIIFKTITDFLSHIGGLFTSLKLIIVVFLSGFTIDSFLKSTIKSIKRVEQAKGGNKYDEIPTNELI